VKTYPYWWDTVPGADAPGTENSELGTENSFPSPQPPVPTPQFLVPGQLWDVAVIGGGYTGLSAARELARRGASVIVFERERVGWGASSRNGGQILTGLKPDPATLVASFGESRACRLFAASLESISALEQLIVEEAIDCDYERTGHVQAAAKPSHFNLLRDEQALLARTFAHRVELLSRSDQRLEIDSSAYFGLLVDERSGAINPARFVNGLAAAARRAGVAIAERTAVTAFRRNGARWGVVTDRGRVESRDVVVATNGYTDGAAPWLRRRLIPIGGYVIATERLPPSEAASLLPKRRMAFDSRHFLHYFRLTTDRRLLFGGRAAFGQATPASTLRCAEILRRDLLAVFPALASVQVEYAWSGNVAFTRDQLPHAGRLEGAHYAGGYCGHGVAMATYLGGLIGRRIAGEPVEHPLLDDHFPAIPLYRGTPWFLPLAGAYYRVKDWLD
jgi:glycine/D-amino acid oxidase-like deaminating enzyme